MSYRPPRESAPLGYLVPPPSRVPKHDHWKVRGTPGVHTPVTAYAREQVSVTISPWRGGWAEGWWTYHRLGSWRTDEAHCAARVYLNGFGTDPEIRFTVHPPFDSEHYGASNDFIRVTRDLRGLLDLPTRRLGARGLADPQPGDFLTIMRWCDVFLARMIDRKHDVRAPGGARDPLDPLVVPAPLSPEVSRQFAFGVFGGAGVFGETGGAS